MKHLKSYKIFESKSEKLRDLEDIFLEVNDGGAWQVTVEERVENIEDNDTIEYFIFIEPNISREDKVEYIENKWTIEISDDIIESIERAKDFIKMNCKIVVRYGTNNEEEVDVADFGKYSPTNYNYKELIDNKWRYFEVDDYIVVVFSEKDQKDIMTW